MFSNNPRLFIEKSEQFGKTIDQIYEKATSRQEKLISLLFDACLDTARERYGASDCSELLLKKSDDFDNADSMVKFLYDNKEAIGIHIIDGKVKSKSRVKEKADSMFAGNPSYVNDINRATVVSDNPSYIDAVIDKIVNSIPEKDRSIRNEWEMKYFGMLTRSSYVSIDGFPAEIHFNDPKQIELGKFTHTAYEIYRTPIKSPQDQEKFKKDFNKFVGLAKTKSDEYDTRMFAETYNETDFQGNEQILARRNEIMSFNLKAHSIAFTKSNEDWQIKYLVAMKKYNHRLELQGRAEQKMSDDGFSPDVKEKADEQHRYESLKNRDILTHAFHK